MQLEDAYMSYGMRVYAIGDVHGCLNELKALIKKIDAHEKTAPSPSHKIIFLGDYVDRGPANCEVIDFMCSLSKSNRDCVFLKGNHDQRFEDFCQNPNQYGEEFMRWGGGPTLRDYGVVPHPGESYASMAERLNGNMPACHIGFIKNLEFFYSIGDYYFCHAGIRPGVRLAEQSPSDLMWIRNEFIPHAYLYEKIIIHGHTMCDEPEVMPNRINIDTGCYQSGMLTALVLEGNSKTFIHT